MSLKGEDTMTIKIAYFTSAESDLRPVVKAAGRIAETHGDRIKIYARSKSDFVNRAAIDTIIKESCAAGVAIIHLHGGRDSLPDFDRLAEALREAGTLLHIQALPSEDEAELRALSSVGGEDYQRIGAYINYSGTENFYNLFLYLANRFGGCDFAFKEPAPLPWEGIYHPRHPGGIELQAYLEQHYLPDRLTVGIPFYQSSWVAQNTEHIDALIEAVEKRGANVIPVFAYTLQDVELGTKGLKWVMENYFMRDGEPLVDVLISALAFSQTMMAGQNVAPGQENCFVRLGVPVIKAILSLNTYNEWAGTLQGLNPLDVSFNVALPEFDGALITVPVATREFAERDPLTGATMISYHPVPERVGKVAGLALKWAGLRHKPNQDKKVAIIFHNYPPRNDTIGSAFGLDSPVSVLNILREMKAAGYALDSLPENGQELMEEILRRVTNDRRWASAEQMASLAVDGVAPEEYEHQWRTFPPQVQEKMKKDWGDPPGEVFNYGGRLLIPGIVNGNVFIGLQPPRGFLDDPAKIYHSPDASPPHHYLAYYRWIRDDFEADAVLHIGKHGSLEWLPGKSVGLSGSCYPDLAITDLPHIYPYIINNPGEGTQAKRRSYCCIMDHLIPVMTNADSYDELAGLEVLLEDYTQARTLDPGKLSYLEGLIWEKVQAAHLDRDLDCDERSARQNFEEFLEKLHAYLSEIKDTQIRDGLHIFGRPPEGEKMVEMLIALTRLANGGIPSLRQGVATALGYDYDLLLSERGKIFAGTNKTGGQLLDEINVLVRQMVDELYRRDFDHEAAPEIRRLYLGRPAPDVEKTLCYAATVLVAKLNDTTCELTHTLMALDGRFVPPGPSGAPTRGMADILPTGRNFFSVDPQAIPSPAAWEVGVALGDALMARYLSDEGGYPESIGMVVWGSPTMRTKGDDIAEILYLMGVKPVWEEKSGRVKGLRIIPAGELGHPRIDVTLRISGFFRDAFPNLVSLLDEAVEMVAGLPEEEVENYLARHVQEDMAANLAEGKNPETAREMALYRIFGCRPGAYGAGVSNAIDAKNWKDEKDLGQVYVTWGGYAYGRKNYGVTVPEVFKKRLSRLDLTVKNEDSREYDILDSDDNYSYHGGMIAAVKAFKGALPRSYSGDSSDPDRVKMRSTAEEARHIFRSRILNPKWIESMKRHGYKGAGDLSRMVDISFGWDATAEVLEDWMYDALAQKYALDPAMQEWFKEVNPWALQNIAERLLEAVERKMWEATPEMVEQLREIYLDVEGELEERTDFQADFSK
jgi:cobaltochelatase CobN